MRLLRLSQKPLLLCRLPLVPRRHHLVRSPPFLCSYFIVPSARTRPCDAHSFASSHTPLPATHVVACLASRSTRPDSVHDPSVAALAPWKDQVCVRNSFVLQLTPTWQCAYMRAGISLAVPSTAALATDRFVLTLASAPTLQQIKPDMRSSLLRGRSGAPSAESTWQKV